MSCGGSIFDEFDLENGYIEEEKLLSYWEMQKKILHSIYKFAIQVCKNSFFECCEMDLELFCDYMVFELENQAEEGGESLVSMDDDW